MLNISLSFQVLPEGLQRRSFEFAQIDIVFHNEPHRLSNQKNFVYQAEIGD